MRATDRLAAIVVSYPNYKSPMHFYTKMQEDMGKISESANDLDFGKRTYAKGYCAYYNARYNEALNEWKKYIHFTGGSEEVNEYMNKIDNAIKLQYLMKRDAELEAESNEILSEGIKKYKSKKWVACIKSMEKLQKFVTDNKFSKTLEYYNTAKEYIEKSVNELSKTIKKEKKIEETSKNIVIIDTVTEKHEVDEALADKKYNEALVFYAQGKYFEAERTWELVLRLNPGHQKAKVALSKLHSSGYVAD